MMERLISPLQYFWATLWFNGFTKWVTAMLAAWVVFVAPEPIIETLLLGAFVGVMLDFVTGIVASLHVGHRITSAKMSHTLIKLLMYASVITMVSFVPKATPMTPEFKDFATTYATGVVLAWVLLTETISIVENALKADVKMPKKLKKWLKDRIGFLEDKGFASLTVVENEGVEEKDSG